MHTNTHTQRSGELECIQVEIRPNQPTFGPAGGDQEPMRRQ